MTWPVPAQSNITGDSSQMSAKPFLIPSNERCTQPPGPQYHGLEMVPAGAPTHHILHLQGG